MGLSGNDHAGHQHNTIKITSQIWRILLLHFVKCK